MQANIAIALVHTGTLSDPPESLENLCQYLGSLLINQEKGEEINPPLYLMNAPPTFVGGAFGITSIEIIELRIELGIASNLVDPRTGLLRLLNPIGSALG